MNQDIPFSVRKPQPIRQVSIDGEYFDDDVPPLLFDEDEDREALVLYARIYEDTMNE